MAEKAALAVREYIKTTIYGYESAFFKAQKLLPVKINTEPLTAIIPSVTVNYFNIITFIFCIFSDLEFSC